MENTTEGYARRLEKLNRYLLIGAIVLAITVVLLAASDFA